MNKKQTNVRTKVDTKGGRNKRLAVGDGFVAAQAIGDPQNKLAAEVAAIVKTRTNITALLAKGVSIKAMADQNQTDLVIADAAHEGALQDYARAAARIVGPDALLLGTLGVTASTRAQQGANDFVGATTLLRVLSGPSEGAARARCRKVLHAASYVFQYKLEPSKPEDPWLLGAETKHVEAIIPNLPPQQLIRVRVRAIGGTTGPWSEEVVGRAG